MEGEQIAALITKAGAKLIYLPPYSPEVSPIETCWSKIKSVLRSMGVRNYPDLVIAVEKAFDIDLEKQMVLRANRLIRVRKVRCLRSIVSFR